LRVRFPSTVTLLLPSARCLIGYADNGGNCAPTVAWRAVWDNICQSAQLICCETVLDDYAKYYYYNPGSKCVRMWYLARRWSCPRHSDTQRWEDGGWLVHSRTSTPCLLSHTHRSHPGEDWTASVLSDLPAQPINRWPSYCFHIDCKKYIIWKWFH